MPPRGGARRSASAALAAALLAPLGARGALNALVWPTTAFAPPASGAASVVPGVGPAGVPPAAGTVRLTGTIVAPAAETLGFVVRTDGGVRLWVDDHLIVDDGDTLGRVRDVASFLNVSFLAGVPQPFRLDYMHVGAAPAPALALSWVGNVTALAPVPAGAFTTAVTPAEGARVALRDRLVNPVDVPWQTYDNPTMGGHVLMPTGFSLYATLADDANKTLGDVFVFRRSDPAVVYMGAHSFNGSDFTSLRIDAWRGRACSVTFETTVVARNLYFLARANGTDCAALRLLVAPRMLWSRAGAFAGGGAAPELTATMPGFPPVTAHAVGAAPAPFPGQPHAWALQLGDGAVVGYATGPAAVAPGDMAAAIAAAATRAAATANKHGADVADVYEPIQTVIAWNTMFTPYEGVVTPVSRGWDFGSGYVLFGERARAPQHTRAAHGAARVRPVGTRRPCSPPVRPPARRPPPARPPPPPRLGQLLPHVHGRDGRRVQGPGVLERHPDVPDAHDGGLRAQLCVWPEHLVRPHRAAGGRARRAGDVQQVARRVARGRRL